MAILAISQALATASQHKLLHNHGTAISRLSHNWLRCFLMESLCRWSWRVLPWSPPVNSRVPQGSVLGPLLFPCDINNLPEGVTSQVSLFVDDCLTYRD